MKRLNVHIPLLNVIVFFIIIASVTLNYFQFKHNKEYKELTDSYYQQRTIFEMYKDSISKELIDFNRNFDKFRVIEKNVAKEDSLIQTDWMAYYESRMSDQYSIGGGE